MDTKNAIRIKAFGLIADKLNSAEVQLDEVDNTEQLRKLLYEKYPQLKEVDFAIAVDKKITVGNAPLKPGAEVALLPPFSGG